MSQQPGWGDPRTGAPGGYGHQQHPQYGEVVPYQTPASYSAQPFMQPMYATAPARPTNTMAILALVFSLIGLFLWGIGHILALIFGIIGKKQIKETGEGGSGMATAGIIISAICLGLGVIGVVLYIVFIVALVGTLGVAGS